VGLQLSVTPEVWRFNDFASLTECLYLIETAEPLLQQSVVVDPVTGQFRPHPVRTSEGATFPWVSEDLVVTALNRRIAVASGTDASCGEPLQVLRYRPGQEYRPHLDALPTGANQRVLTMLVYLNEDYEGGETLFSRTGLKYAGKAGDGLLFRNANPDGVPDPSAEHAGLPVLAGEKYVASRWIRERPLMAS
jgi:prolyl 4-hydroxylase